MPIVLSEEIILWISRESAGEQWSDDVKVYWSSERDKRLRKKGNDDPVESGRREREKGE